MRGPFSHIPEPRLGRLLRAMLAVTVVVYAGLFVIEVHTFTDAAPFGQISFQLAGTGRKAAEIIASWEEAGVVHMAGASLGFDYLFLVSYGLGLAVAGSWVEVRARRLGRTSLIWLGALAGWAGLVAATLDAVENARLLRLLGDPGVDAAGPVLILASIKLGLLGFALVVWLAGAVRTRA